MRIDKDGPFWPIVCTAIVLLLSSISIMAVMSIPVGTAQGQQSMGQYVDTMKSFADTVVSTGAATAVTIVGAETMKATIVSIESSGDEIHATYEVSDDGVNWTAAHEDSFAVEDGDPVSFVFPWASVYAYHRVRINDADPASGTVDSTKVTYRAGGRISR